MVAVMRMDIMSNRQFFLLGALSVTIVICGLIAGSSGPPVFDTWTNFAYECPNLSHEWSEECKGVRMDEGTPWNKNYPYPLGPLNRMWALEMTPFYKDPTGPNIEREISVDVRITARHNLSDHHPVEIFHPDTRIRVACFTGEMRCQGEFLVLEDVITFKYYTVMVEFNTSGSFPADFIGDVEFKYWAGESKFSEMQLGFRVTFLLISLVIIVAYLITMREVRFEEWTWEQRALGIVLISTVFLNNPFFLFRFLVAGWFFFFLDSLMEVTFLSILLLFWLFMVDKIRMEELRLEFSLNHIPKIVIVAVYAILAIVLFTWVNLRDQTDPVFGNTSTGLMLLFYLVTSIFLGIIIWLIVLVILTVPVVQAKRHLLNRFCFISIPTGWCVFSIIVGMLAGTYGPLNRTSLEFAYYATMFNVYVWVLTVGYWPVDEKFSMGNPTESTGLNFENREPSTERSNVSTQNN